MVEDVIEKFLRRKEKPVPTEKVNPFQYPDKRIDDWQGGAPKRTKYVNNQNEPISIIQTISDKQYKRLTGSDPAVVPKVIRVQSPILTTQPQISFAPDEIAKANGPKIRVLEGGRGTPETRPPFTNPWTSTNPNSSVSLMEEGKADPRGKSLSHSTTPAYDEMKKKMGNLSVRIDGEQMDILLPVNAKEAEDEFSGTRISVGGVPGFLNIKSKENGYYGREVPIGTKRPVRVAHWDGTLEEEGGENK